MVGQYFVYFGRSRKVELWIHSRQSVGRRAKETPTLQIKPRNRFTRPTSLSLSHIVAVEIRVALCWGSFQLVGGGGGAVRGVSRDFCQKVVVGKADVFLSDCRISFG